MSRVRHLLSGKLRAMLELAPAPAPAPAIDVRQREEAEVHISLPQGDPHPAKPPAQGLHRRGHRVVSHGHALRRSAHSTLSMHIFSTCTWQLCTHNSHVPAQHSQCWPAPGCPELADHLAEDCKADNLQGQPTRRLNLRSAKSAQSLAHTLGVPVAPLVYMMVHRSSLVGGAAGRAV